ncbi:hypothetical protein SH139x_002808 [Planctomycetaceae bacterium SH139]
MELLIQLNDGPLDGVEIVTDSDVFRRVRSITAEVAVDDDVEALEDAELVAAKYDLYINEPTAADDGSTLCYYHEDSTLLPSHPLGKLRHFLSERDRQHWDDWLSDISLALDECYRGMDSGARGKHRAKKAYLRARKQIDAVPDIATKF